MKERIISEQQLKRKTIISFLLFFLLFAAGFFAWKRLRKEPQEAGIAKTLRKGLQANEPIFSSLYQADKLVQTYPQSEAVKKVRVNGNLGLRAPVDTAQWSFA